MFGLVNTVKGRLNVKLIFFCICQLPLLQLNIFFQKGERWMSVKFEDTFPSKHQPPASLRSASQAAALVSKDGRKIIVLIVDRTEYTLFLSRSLHNRCNMNSCRGV